MLVLACLLVPTQNVTKVQQKSTGLFCHTAPGKRKGPVAETLGNLVGAEGLHRRCAPAPRCGARRALRATLENARAFPQLRSLPGSSPRTAPGKRKGPVAGTFDNLVGAEGLEPSILAARDFKSPAYANSATPPCVS